MQRDNAKLRDAREQIMSVQSVIEGFALVNGYIPCPATPASNGTASPAGGTCAAQHGFVPATTLDLNGQRNADNLLLDPWGSPLRYSVSSSDANTDGCRIAIRHAIRQPTAQETDVGSGISNSVLNGVPESIDAIGTFPGFVESHNDSVVSISRSDIEQRVSRRADFQSGMRSLGLAAASCLANYAANNPGGPSDKRLPWPGSVVMPDYRPDAAYDDADIGFLSGRLPDGVADSNTTTGNSIARVLSDCDTVAVPEWTLKTRTAWQNWKDHFFYAVADSFSPAAATPSTCVNCLTVNGSGQYAGVLLFANSRLQSLGQVRNEPPIDADTKGDVSNYLEDVNAGNVPGTAASTDYMSAATSNVFNDSLFCIDDQLVVTVC